MSLAWPVIPSTTINSIPVATATIASINSAAPSARGTRWRLSQPTSGEPTAATIAATITGTTITAVREASQTRPTSSTATPTSNHDISPTLRSQSGTVKIRLSSPGSISTYSSSPSSLAERSRRCNRPRITERS